MIWTYSKFMTKTLLNRSVTSHTPHILSWAAAMCRSCSRSSPSRRWRTSSALLLANSARTRARRLARRRGFTSPVSLGSPVSPSSWPSPQDPGNDHERTIMTTWQVQTSPTKSKRVQTGPNGSKQVQTGPNRSKQVQTGPNRSNDLSFHVVLHQVRDRFKLVLKQQEPEVRQRKQKNAVPTKLTTTRLAQGPCLCSFNFHVICPFLGLCDPMCHRTQLSFSSLNCSCFRFLSWERLRNQGWDHGLPDIGSMSLLSRIRWLQHVTGLVGLPRSFQGTLAEERNENRDPSHLFRATTMAPEFLCRYFVNSSPSFRWTKLSTIGTNVSKKDIYVTVYVVDLW